MTRAKLLPLMRRTVEIDYRYKHRHLPGSLTALPIIAEIYQNFDESKDVFILSKGHSCAALYAVMESRGKHPDVTKVHPERDPENGITITSGSLGHGLPIAVGVAYAKKLRGEPGMVHVLMGDGECQEGTTWESALLARRLEAGNLRIHLDLNGFQGGVACIYGAGWIIDEILMPEITVKKWHPDPDLQVRLFPLPRTKSVHTIIEQEYQQIMEELQ